MCGKQNPRENKMPVQRQHKTTKEFAYCMKCLIPMALQVGSCTIIYSYIYCSIIYFGNFWCVVLSKEVF